METVSGTELPPLERCGITIDGLSKSGKTAALAGNERLIILKCYDGNPIIPRCRAKIIVCHTLKEMQRNQDELRLLASKLGKDSFYCQIAYDPIATLIRWYSNEAVFKHNQDKCYDKEGKFIPMMAGKLVESADDIGGYGPWNSIATKIQNLLISWAELGWGWIAPIHYQWKAASNFDGGMSYKPNIPPTTADRLDLISDVAITTERTTTDDGNNVFMVRYTASVTKKVGSRIPLTGYCECPNYQDKDTPAAVTTWDYIAADYAEACQSFTKDQSKFAAAWVAIKKKAKIEE